ncbi:hypothetical protein TNCV_1065791 [Trichonephila clavipes]|nr:hypothetical protein TNCV_1065791 [Trichonephila clavipes]
MSEKVSVLMDCRIASSEELVAVNDNVCIALIMVDKDILEFGQSSKITFMQIPLVKIEECSFCSHVIRNERHHEKYVQLPRCSFLWLNE